MSEIVQFASLQPHRTGHASRTAQGDNGSDSGFDAILGEADERHVPLREFKTAAPAKGEARQNHTDEDEAPARGVGGGITFFSRLFALDDTSGEQQPVGKNTDGKAALFKAEAASDKANTKRADEDETAAPVIAIAVSEAGPMMRDARADPAAEDRKPTGKTGILMDGAAKAPKSDTAATNTKEAPASKASDATAEADQKHKAAHGNVEPVKEESARGPETGQLAKVKVVSAQTTPAPIAAPLPSPTATALARAIHAGTTSGAEAAHAAADVAQKPAAPAMVHTLNIQLQPETLGTVTARLHLSGDNLRVELQVDNADAHHRLKTDSDTIVKSLRALGYDVDRITVQAPTPGQPAASGHNAASQGREQPFQQAAGNSSGNGQGSSHAGSGRENGQNASHQTMERQDQHSSAGGLFI